jgi:hypothetical protein
MSNLPSQHVLTALTDSFFHTINLWYPILHYSSITVLLEDLDNLSEEDAVLLHAIIVATTRFATDDLLDESERKFQRERSLNLVKLYVLQHVSLRTVQTLAILSIDAFGVDRMPGLLALARRQLTALHTASINSETRSSYSSPYSVFDERMEDISSVDPECRARVTRVISALEQSCFIVTAARTRSLFDHNPSFVDQLQVLTASCITATASFDPAMEEDASFKEQCEAFKLLSIAITFGQKSMASRGVAAQKSWRSDYAGLHRRLRHGLASRREMASEYQPQRDLYTSQVILLT